MDQLAEPFSVASLPKGLGGGIHKSESDGELRLAWGNNTSGLWFLCGIALFSGVVMVLFAAEGYPTLYILLSVGCWLSVVALVCLVQTRWVEWLVISTDSIAHGFVGFLAPKLKIFPVDRVREIAISYYIEQNDSSVRLYIDHDGRWFQRRHTFGWGLAVDAKEELIATIALYIKQHNLPLRVTQYGQPLGKFMADFRFSMRSLMIFVTVITLIMGLIASVAWWIK